MTLRTNNGNQKWLGRRVSFIYDKSYPISDMQIIQKYKSLAILFLFNTTRMKNKKQIVNKIFMVCYSNLELTFNSFIIFSLPIAIPLNIYLFILDEIENCERKGERETDEIHRYHVSCSIY